MKKANFMIKNHKKLIIQRQGKENQLKKLGEGQKAPLKLSSLNMGENIKTNIVSLLQQKQQFHPCSQPKKKTLHSSQKSVQSPKRNNQSQQIPENSAIRRRTRLKSSFFSLRESNLEPNRLLLDFSGKSPSMDVQKTAKRLIQYLKIQGWANQSRQSYIELNQSCLSMLISSTIQETMASSIEFQFYNQKNNEFSRLIQQIKNLLKPQGTQKRKKPLKIQSNAFIHSYSSHQYHQQESNFLQSVHKLSQEEAIIKSAITTMKDTLTILSKQCDIKQDFHNGQVRELYQMTSQTLKKTQQLNRVAAALHQAKSEYQDILQKEQHIFTYVMKQENNKIIKLVSEDYKQIEADIYEYAVYLQSNQLASNINYQPHPFHLIQKDLMEQMKSVNKTIIQEDNQAPQQKLKLMRDFVLKVFEKFKKKDQQMSGLCGFKTKCIKQFVSQMKKWLNNWQLKQQYLVNLRREFAADSNAFLNKIQEINRKIHGRHDLAQEINTIKDIFHKIEVNYMMGNSFY